MDRVTVTVPPRRWQRGGVAPESAAATFVRPTARLAAAPTRRRRRRLAPVTAGELTSSRARRPPIGLVKERVYNRGASCHFKVDR